MPVILRTSDNQEFTVDKEIVMQSSLLKYMIEFIGESDTVIPLPNVSSSNLQRIIEWCEHHRNDSPRNAADIDKFDQKTLFELILAANYLDIKPLLELACKTVVNIIKRK